MRCDEATYNLQTIQILVLVGTEERRTTSYRCLLGIQELDFKSYLVSSNCSSLTTSFVVVWGTSFISELPSVWYHLFLVLLGREMIIELIAGTANYGSGGGGGQGQAQK